MIDRRRRVRHTTKTAPPQSHSERPGRDDRDAKIAQKTRLKTAMRRVAFALIEGHPERLRLSRIRHPRFSESVCGRPPDRLVVHLKNVAAGRVRRFQFIERTIGLVERKAPAM
jgi:hypothetical protein